MYSDARNTFFQRASLKLCIATEKSLQRAIAEKPIKRDKGNEGIKRCFG